MSDESEKVRNSIANALRSDCGWKVEVDGNLFLVEFDGQIYEALVQPLYIEKEEKAERCEEANAYDLSFPAPEGS